MADIESNKNKESQAEGLERPIEKDPFNIEENELSQIIETAEIQGEVDVKNAESEINSKLGIVKEIAENPESVAVLEEISQEADAEILKADALFEEEISGIKNEDKNESNVEKAENKESVIFGEATLSMSEKIRIKDQISKTKNPEEKEALKKELEEKEAVLKKIEGEYHTEIRNKIKEAREKNPEITNEEITKTIIKPSIDAFEYAKQSGIPQKEPGRLQKGLASVGKAMSYGPLKNPIVKKILLTTIGAGITTLILPAAGAAAGIGAVGMFTLKVARMAISSNIGERIGEKLGKGINKMGEKHYDKKGGMDELEKHKKKEAFKKKAEFIGKITGILSGLTISGATSAADVKILDLVASAKSMLSNTALEVAHSGVSAAGIHGTAEAISHGAEVAHGAHHGIGSVVTHEAVQGSVDTTVEKGHEKAEKHHHDEKRRAIHIQKHHGHLKNVNQILKTQKEKEMLKNETVLEEV